MNCTLVKPGAAVLSTPKKCPLWLYRHWTILRTVPLPKFLLAIAPSFENHFSEWKTEHIGTWGHDIIYHKLSQVHTRSTSAPALDVLNTYIIGYNYLLVKKLKLFIGRNGHTIYYRRAASSGLYPHPGENQRHRSAQISQKWGSEKSFWQFQILCDNELGLSWLLSEVLFCLLNTT